MLKQTDMVATTTGTTDLELTLARDESAIIKGILWHEPDAVAEDLTVKVDRRSVLQIKAPATWRVLSRLDSGGIRPIWDVFKRLGLTPTIPVGPGQKLTITGGTANDIIQVLYDLYDADDVDLHAPNGSESSEYDLFQVISNSEAPAVAKDVELDVSDLDSIFPAFPGGAVVPANTEMTLRALFGAGVATGTGSANAQHTSYVKFLADRVDLFDQALIGRVFKGNAAFTTDATTYLNAIGELSIPESNQDARVIVFDNPIVFPAGTELNVFTTVVETTGAYDLAIGEIKMGLLFRVRKTG